MTKPLYAEVLKITDSEIKNFVFTALNNAPEQFWVDPCSGTGKNHPPEDNGDGGIIRHTIKAVAIGSELCRLKGISPLDIDFVLSSIILHDIKKNGDPWGKSTHPEHGLIAYHWLGQFDLKQPAKSVIRKAVRYHMGRWAKPEIEGYRALHSSPIEEAVQTADFVASRKCASFLPGCDVPEDIISAYLGK